MGLHGWFNAVEAAVWILAGVALATNTRRQARPYRRIGRVGSVSLVIFGVTDVVEIFTGSFAAPPALLVLNAACLLSILLCYLRFCRIRRVLKKGP